MYYGTILSNLLSDPYKETVIGLLTSGRYRTSGGEWLSDPFLSGKSYRTTERIPVVIRTLRRAIMGRVRESSLLCDNVRVFLYLRAVFHIRTQFLSDRGDKIAVLVFCGLLSDETA